MRDWILTGSNAPPGCPGLRLEGPPEVKSESSCGLPVGLGAGGLNLGVGLKSGLNLGPCFKRGADFADFDALPTTVPIPYQGRLRN